MTKDPKTIIIPVVIVVVIVAVLALAVYFSTDSDDDSSTTNGLSYDNALADGVTEEDWQKGADDPRVTIVDFSDFQCPACGFTHSDVLDKLVQEYPDDIRIVFRHYPISSHELAQKAAEVAEAAGVQGKFWEMIDKVFEKQKEFSSEDQLYEWAKELELDVGKIKSEVKSSEWADEVEADRDSGKRSGLTATPTLYINGVKYEGKLKYEDIKEEVVKHLP